MERTGLSDLLSNETTGQGEFPGNGLARLLDEPVKPKAQEPAEEATGGAPGKGNSVSMPPSASVAEFVKNAMPAAQRVAKRLNVPVEAVIGQWGLETGWGKSVIPGTNNLGNIKDFRGGGVSAKDNANGSVDKYRQYGSVDEFAEDFANLLGNTNYKAVPGTKDAQAYFAALKAARYAEDPDYVAKGTSAAKMVAEAMGKSGQGGTPDLSKAPKWNDITGKPEFKSLSPAEKVEAKKAYFDYWIAPQAGDQADALREQFMAKSDEPGWGQRLSEGLDDLNKRAADAIKGVFTKEPSALERPNADVPKNEAASMAPVRPEVRAQFNAIWDSATPQQREAMAQQPGWRGMLARERAGIYSQPGAQLTQTGQQFDPRVESRREALIAKGEDARAADTFARMGARQGIQPGLEVAKLGGVQASEFDFDTKQAFGGDQANGLNNVLARGLSKGALGFGKAITGYGEFLSDVYGLDETGKTMREGNKWARGKEEAIGQRGNLMERNLEGAIASIAQQLPLMIGGIKAGSEAIPLAGMAMQAFGQEYTDGRAQGQSIEQAATRAAVFAAFEVIGEKFGLKANMSGLKALAAGKPADEVMRLFAAAMAKDVPGELLTTTGQFGTDKFAPGGVGLNPQGTLEQYASAMVDTLIQTLMQGGIMGGAGYIRPTWNALKGGQQTNGQIEAGALTARDRAMNAWETNGLSPSAQPGAQASPRAEPAMAPHQTVQDADQIVRELAEQAGVPLETVLPESVLAPAALVDAQPQVPAAESVPAATQAQGQFSDNDVLAFAESRYRTLRDKAEGGVSLVPGDEGMVEQEIPGVPLNEAEQRELDALAQAGKNPAALRAMYGFDNQRTEVADAAPAESEADRDARLVREAIQAEGPSSNEAQADDDIPGFGDVQPNGIEPQDEKPSKTGTGSKSVFDEVDKAGRVESDAWLAEISAKQKAGEKVDWKYYQDKQYNAIQSAITDRAQDVAAAIVANADQNGIATLRRAMKRGDELLLANVVDMVNTPNAGAIMTNQAVKAAVLDILRKQYPNDAPAQAAGTATEGAGVSQPTQEQPKPKTEKEARAQKDYSEKWFGTAEKAQAFIAKQGIGESHEVAQDGKKFIIKKKGSSNGTQATQAQQAGAQQQEAGDQGNAAQAGTGTQGPGVPATGRTDVQADGLNESGLVVIPADAQAFADMLTDEINAADGDERLEAIFRPGTPKVVMPKTVEGGRAPKAMPFMSAEDAAAEVEAWKAEAKRQGKENASANAGRTVISLFDASGVMAQPWFDAGYNVVTYDLQNGQDINDFSAEMLIDEHGNDNVWAVIAQPPCTDFASSGAQWWKEKDADGRTEASNELVRQALRTVELLRPAVWVMENPVGRIAEQNNLPDPLLSFDPWHFGDPWTKRTMYWGRFNNQLPTAAVAPTEGSKVHKLSSGNKYERSLTPEGVAYATFMANNAEGMTPSQRMAFQFPGVERALFADALDAGKSESDVRTEIEDAYNDGDLETVRETLEGMAAKQEPALPGDLAEMLERANNRVPEGYEVRVEGNAVSLYHDGKRTEYHGLNLNDGGISEAVRQANRLFKDAAESAKQPAAADIDAMFDEVLAEELAKDEAKKTDKPKTEKEAKAKRAEAPVREMTEEGRAKDGKPINGGDVFRTLSGRTTTPYPKQKGERYASDWLIENAKAEAQARGDDFNTTGFGAVTKLKGGNLTEADKAGMLMYLFGEQPAVVPSILKPLASAGKNSAAALANAIDGLGALFGGAGKLSSGFTFDEDTYAKAKPLFKEAVANIGDAGKDLREAMRAVIRMVLDKFGAQAAQNMKPYAVRFIEESSQGKGEVDEAATPATVQAEAIYTPEGKFKVAQQLADHMIGGGAFDTIVAARKMIGDIIGRKIEPATELAKQADETVEVAVVLAAREMIAAGRKQGRSPQVIYDRLLSLFKAQPNLAVRSSTSMRDQAYSTPVPLAYVASQLAGVTPDTKMIESTAGNGMLAIGASLANATVNELNPKRAAMLEAMGFKPTTENAATATLAPARSQDAVVINPPFGATKDSQGNTIVYEVKPDYGTREVDHAIVFKTLEAMKDDGRAVLIVGGVMSEADEARREDYRGKNKRMFYFNLYRDYNVVDHFTVDGALYAKQGASYPVDVIVINGRGKSSRDLPAAALPHIIRSYEELKEKLNAESSLGARGADGADVADSGTGGAGNLDDTQDVAGRPGASGGRVGTQGEKPSAGGAAGVRGAGSGRVNGQPQPGGAVPPAEQLEPQGVAGGVGDRQGAVRGEGAGKRGSTGSTGNERLPALGGPGIVSGERVQSGLTDRRGEEQETETQVAYTPQSGATSVGTLVPRAMKDAIEGSLQRIADEVGDLDQYVADSLAMDPETLRENFSAEQVDALALAIRNAEAGKGFIIGDQTGIGKGRVVAAMIRYALINDKTPVFVTEKPNLYSDMIRDLDDIGMTDDLGLDTENPRIFITNSDETIPYTLLRTEGDEVVENNLTLRPAKRGAALNDLMQSMMEGESLGDYKVIFTTYSQMQTVKGAETTRQKFVKQFGASNYMIFDESHNAGGAGETQARTKEQRKAEKAGQSLVTGRAAFVRELVTSAYGTFFSSATYAKRPDVMDLYSSTNMRLAVDKIADLGAAIKAGGVPMQQVVANMLTQDGQYIRRERTFAGVSYDTVPTTVDKQTAENMASAMRSILAFSRRKDILLAQMQKEADKEGAMLQAVGGAKTSIEGANFGAIMHNLIDQMLLALKVESSVKHAIERLKAGEKVVMTVSNTMGSFLKEYADEMGINTGDVVGLSFGDLYLRYLEKQRNIKIKRPGGQVEEKRLSDAELGPELTQLFNDIKNQIGNAGFGSAPISPIDYMHTELRKAGYATDEITGRTMVLNYVDGTPTLASRTANIKQRVNAVRGFNNGTVDVLILNQAGSTGLSLHAASKFKDQRKRHMIIVQAEKNIDTHMQMLGRVHRTGQVVTPSYSQMMADIPAEMRPAAVLLKKMASLNANTTASRKSAVTAEGVVDFMNDYGGQVVHEFLRDNPDVHSALGGGKVLKLLDEVEEATEDDIRKLTGYIPILPIAEQERIYADLIQRYNELIERENSLGTNKLEAKALDLDAETIKVQPLTEQKQDPSIFAAPANMELVDVKRTVKPFSSEEVKAAVKERLGGQTNGAPIAAEMVKSLRERGQAFIDERMKKAEASDKADPVRLADQRMLLQMTLNRVATVLETFRIGQQVSVADKNTGVLYGVITDIAPGGRTANPAAGSDWKMTIALANGDAKSITINFSQIGNRYQIKGESTVNWYNAETQQGEEMRVIDIFDKGVRVRREKRWIVTGNILAGFSKFQGQIITYTKKDGTVGQGVLMSRQFDFDKEIRGMKVGMRNVAAAMEFFKTAGMNSTIGTEDGNFKIMATRSQFSAMAPSAKRLGGSYYLDSDLTEAIGADFYKKGTNMVATVPDYRIAEVLDYLINTRGETLVALTHNDVARKLAGLDGAETGGNTKSEGVKFNAQDSADGYTWGHEKQQAAKSTPQKTERSAKNIRQLHSGVVDYLRGDGQAVDDRVQPYVAVDVPAAQAIREIAKTFGIEVQWFDLAEGLTPEQKRQFGGFNGANYKGVQYLRASGVTRPHLAILGHEVAHQLRRDHPDLYDEFVDAVNRYIKPAAYKKFLTLPVAKAKDPREEFSGEVLSDLFMERDFWNGLGAQNPSLLQRMVDLVVSLVDKLMNTVGYTKVSAPYLSDYRKVMEIAADVMTRYAGRQVKAGQGAQDGLSFNAQGQTNTESFRKWFGDSKVVDNEGTPLVVYHGTTADVTAFSDEFFGEGHGASDWGDGFYFTNNPKAANTYAEGQGGNVMPVYLSIKNPADRKVMMSAKVQAALDDDMGFTDVAEVLAGLGYDGIVIDHKGGDKEYIVFKPTQVKSAIGNNGQFDPNNEDIRFNAQDDKGSVPNIVRKVQNNLIQFFGSQSGRQLDTFNAYDKTIGSQYNKALKDKHFGRVYQLLLGMQNHVSMAAMRAAQMAPGVLPQVDDIKGAAKALFSKRKQGSLDSATRAIFMGTLAGENVMQGQVWTKGEFMGRFGNDETAWALYEQTRAAIDASLDEVAAAEAYSLAQKFLTKDMRAKVIAEPGGAEALILNHLEQQLNMARMAIVQAETTGDEQQANEMAAMRDAFKSTIRHVESIFTTAKNLKAAGYAPLMRFGKYTVEAKFIDPMTGNVERDENGQPMTAFFGRFESEKEARKAEARLRVEFDGRDDVAITAGTYNSDRHELYTGVTPETLELFAEATGMGNMADEFIRLAKSDRSAMKRQLERKGTPGFSQDLPRVLSSFITSNARHAAQRLYMTSINQAVKRIPKEKGDVQQEAQKLRNFVLNPDDAGAISSSLMFAWFLGGSVAAAAVNMTQPLMVTLPYLTQFTSMAKASALLTKAMPAAFGKAEIRDKDLREGLERASLEGVVDAQEIFHLYSLGSHQLIKGNRGQAALTLWGSLFSGVEKINRRMTFIAAWNLAKETGEANPYAFAVRAVNQTQGIYNKVNRPNVSRTWAGRMVMTYKGYALMVGELMVRMWKAGPGGKKAVAIMLAMLFLAAGEEGLPMAKALDDLIDTIGQLLGFDTNMRRWKRRTAHEILGQAWGDVFLYGASAVMPLDFGSRLGLGQMLPGTEILKPSSGIFNMRAIGEIIGPTAGAGGQIGDAAEASFEGNYGKAVQNASPKAVRDVLAAMEMATRGQATDARGRKVTDVGLGDAAVKAVGFQPTKVAQEHRKTMPIQQDIALQRKREASIVAKWARAAMDGDQKGVQEAIAERDAWNARNPDTPIVISKQQIMGRVKTMRADKDTRTFKTAPKEMRGRIGLDMLDD